MARRIRRILLVCNNYDSYALDEDGRIEEQITEEYQQMNLSMPPSITRAETTKDALALVERGEQFDVVITMYNVGEVDVFEFSHRMKALKRETPIVLLMSFSKELYRRVQDAETEDIDYVFCWNNSTDLIIAIIKLLEDRVNADHDILEEGVRAILLVEDSVRYYSTYLPLLYRLVIEQNRASLRDALNEKQQLLRKRARPKVLMATCYEEAMMLYERYKENLLGVISDIGFVMKKGDRPETEKLTAGIELCKVIRTADPTMPFLLQSSQEAMRKEAKKLGVGFVVKTSKTLTHDVSDYIGREFGFGDFVVTNPETGEEVGRASDLESIEKMLRTLSVRDFRHFSANNRLSKWLYARGLFALGEIVRPLHAETDEEVEKLRTLNLKMIRDFRINQALGVVAKFDPQTYNDTIWFSRVGNGSLGGKARGLAFLNHILQKHDLYARWEDVRVMVPRTMVITTEYFDRFIVENGLQYVINADITDEEILSEFVASTLPEDLIQALRMFIRVEHHPLAVRSSSKLEDSHYQPFAGVYSTYMIPHTDNEDQELRLLSKAIKSVWASVYFASSRGYITATANVLSEEKMGIVLQEVCGAQDGDLYYPTLSGVARSVNFYPIGREKPEDGIAKIAFGLGKAVVDGDQVLRFSPKYPKHVLQTSTPDLTMRETQQSMFALNLMPEKFKTSIDDAINLEHKQIADCGELQGLRHVVSTFDIENMRMVDSPIPNGPKFVTFAHILKFNTFPLAEIINTLLEIAQTEMKCPVEIEFAANLEHEPQIFNVLQIRPISADSLSAEVDWEDVNEEKAFLSSSSALGTGKMDGIRDIIYLRAEHFDILKTRQMADEIRTLNQQLRREGRGFLLIGFGRWGSSIPSLGVPVQWSDISEARAIVECCLDNFRVDPSQGTHFFQNLTSFNAGYINVNPFAHPDTDRYNEDALNALPAEYESEFVRWVRLPESLTVIIDGRQSKAVIGL